MLEKWSPKKPSFVHQAVNRTKPSSQGLLCAIIIIASPSRVGFNSHFRFGVSSNLSKSRMYMSMPLV